MSSETSGDQWWLLSSLLPVISQLGGWSGKQRLWDGAGTVGQGHVGSNSQISKQEGQVGLCAGWWAWQAGGPGQGGRASSVTWAPGAQDAWWLHHLLTVVFSVNKHPQCLIWQALGILK